MGKKKQSGRPFNLLSVPLALCITTVAGFTQNATTPGAIQSYSTIYSIGIEWNLVGDQNHNAKCSARYRQAGAADWMNAMPLFRVDMPRVWYGDDDPAKAYPSEGPFNMFAGSIMFLNPGASYEVKLDLQDPDGGNRTESLAIQTLPLPALPIGAAAYHVVPGAGGGDGSSTNPFKGLAAAQIKANPGDLILIHKGDYGSFTFNKAGKAAGNYMAWKGAGDGDAVFSDIAVAGSYVWLEGLMVKCLPGAKQGIGGQRGADHVVLARNTILGFNKEKNRGKVAVQYLTLKPGCNAIDAGEVMPNLNEGYTGKAPDLGAYEFGKPVPHFGPRHLPVQGGEPSVMPAAGTK